MAIKIDEKTVVVFCVAYDPDRSADRLENIFGAVNSTDDGKHELSFRYRYDDGNGDPLADTKKWHRLSGTAASVEDVVAVIDVLVNYWQTKFRPGAYDYKWVVERGALSMDAFEETVTRQLRLVGTDVRAAQPRVVH